MHGSLNVRYIFWWRYIFISLVLLLKIINKIHIMCTYLCRLVVQYPPVVSVQPSNLTVNASQPVIIRCLYESNPAKLLSVSWLRDGEVVIAGATVAGGEGGRQQLLRYEGGTVDQPSLTIRATAREDSGSYTCRLGKNRLS